MDARTSRQEKKTLLEHDVFEGNLHRRTGMDLKGKQAIGPTGFLIVVGQFGHFHTIDVMYEMKPLAVIR